MYLIYTFKSLELFWYNIIKIKKNRKIDTEIGQKKTFEVREYSKATVRATNSYKRYILYINNTHSL